MGIAIDRDRFTKADFEQFGARLREDLILLEQVLARPGFGEGPRTMGVELELFLIDGRARPLRIAEEVVRRAANPLVTPEMSAFDVELSTPPVPVAGAPFSALGLEMARAEAAIHAAAAVSGARAVCISVLPTFRREDFDAAAITGKPRYRALAAGLSRLRHAPFRIDIDGEDPLDLAHGDVAMEGANTAFQIHLRVSPREFAAMFNAAMMITGPALAACGNSPTFLGHRLWHETRVAVFMQAGDDRPPAPEGDGGLPPRIGFGTGWVRDGALELFAESVALHEPLLPVCSAEPPASARSSAAGAAPLLPELMLHHGTVWGWNRAVYHGGEDAHLRIELRALPAGPTRDDMLANAAFLVGAVLGLAPSVADLLPSFPFALAERNFYRAAKAGLAAELMWPRRASSAPEKVAAQDLLRSLLPVAAAGLEGAGVDPDEAARWLGLFEARVTSGVTGAVWQRRTLAALEAGGLSREDALAAMTEQYIAAASTGAPVHTWPVPPMPEDRR